MKKRLLSWLLCAAMVIGLVPTMAVSALADELAEAYTLSDDYISVSVSKKNGGFTVRTVEGDRLKKSDNNKELLYHDGQYDTSFVSFRVEDGNNYKDYIFGGKYAGSSAVAVTQENGAIKAVWSVDGLTFTQSISLASAESTESGMVNIGLAVANSGAKRSVKARILYDTALGSQDYGYYQYTDSSQQPKVISQETVLTSGIPQQLFATDDPYSPSVVAYSVNRDKQPEKVAFGHWSHLASTLFDFEPVDTLDFTNTRSEYMTADSAYALYFDLGSVASGSSTSLATYYGVFSNHKTPASDSVAVNLTVPVRLKLNDKKTDFVPDPSAKGNAHFAVTVDITNIAGEDAKDLSNVVLAVQSSGDLRSLDDNGKMAAGQDYTTTEPYTFIYSTLEVGKSETKTLYFQARPGTEAAYERITVGVYDGEVTQDKKLGERMAYVLLPGSDGDVPKVSFAAMTPKIIYTEGTRHLFVTVTNDSLLVDRGNWDLKVYSEDGKVFKDIPHENITIKDGVMDVALTADIQLSEGGWYLQLEWASTSAAPDGKTLKQTAPELHFTVSADKKYKNDAYGILAVVEYKDGVQNQSSSYRIMSFKNEDAFAQFRDNKGTEKYEEILLTFKGEFTATKTYQSGGTGAVTGVYYTATSAKTMGNDGKYVVDNPIVINGCMDFEGGSLNVYYENYENGLDSALTSAICTEFDGELYTNTERTSIWKGKAIFTKIRQGESYSLIPYNENGERGSYKEVRDRETGEAVPGLVTDNGEGFSAQNKTISLIWPSAAGIGQTLSGMIFKLAYGQLGVMYDTENQSGKIEETIGCVVSFTAALDLTFASGKVDPSEADPPTYWSELRQLWSSYNDLRSGSLYNYVYSSSYSRFEQALDWSDINEKGNEDNQKHIKGSVMVRDVLFGCGQGFVGVNFQVGVAIKNYISGLPEIEGTISVSTINDWAFGVEGEIKLATFTVEAKVSFKSKDNIPIPDELYVFVSGFEPGLNIDGLGVLWITGAGGGIKNIYDSIFMTQAVPPLKLLLSVSFDVVKVLACEKATLSLGLTGISLQAEGIGIKSIPQLTAIERMGLSLEWYPGIDLQANIVVDLFQGCIYGGGYIVLLSPDYKDVFFEMFARAQLRVPGSVPIVGGMTLAGIDLGISTEKIWGALEVLFITLGVTYYWGEGSVDFSKGSKTNPTFPDLLGYDDVPVYYDAERDQTLYARVGTNTQIMATSLSDNGGLTLMATGAELHCTDGDNKTAYWFDLGTRASSSDDAIVQITFDAESMADAKTKADSIKVGTSEGENNYGLKLFDTSKDQNAVENQGANANLSYDETTGKATFAFTATQVEQYGKKWYMTTPKGSDVILYNVAAVPEVTSVSGAVNGGSLDLTWVGTELSELDQISFYLCSDKDAQEAGYRIGKVDRDLGNTEGTSGSATLTIPADVPSGDYYIRAVYSKSDEVNGVAFSNDKVSWTNTNTPGAASFTAKAAGNLQYQLTIPHDDNTSGYLVTVYNADCTATDFQNVSYEAADSGNTVINVGGRYQAADPEDSTRVKTFGLTGGKTYTIGVTPYKTVPTSNNGVKGEIAVYGAEVKQTCALPEMVTPTVKFTADKAAQSRTETQQDKDGKTYTAKKNVYTTNELTITATVSEAVTGTWRLDNSETVNKFDTPTDRISIPLPKLTEGEHTITMQGAAADGDGFAATYTFTVDTLPPQLMISAPVNGGFFHKDGTLTVTGVTDADARFTITAGGGKVCENRKLADGEFDPATGVFSFTVSIPDPHSASQHTLTITDADDVGNTTVPQTVTVSHGGLADLASLEVMADGQTYDTGNIPVPAAGLKDVPLTLVGVTSDGTKFDLTGYNVSWEILTVEGTASLEDGKLTAAAGSQGIVTGKLAVANGAYRTATLCFGAPANHFVAVSTTIGGSVTGGGQYNGGDTVTLTATPDSSYRFAGWELTGATVSDLTAATITFTMPANGNVTALARFAPKSGSSGKKYSQTVDAKAGELVRITLPGAAGENSGLPYYIAEDGSRVFVPIAASINGQMTFLAPRSTTYHFMDRNETFKDMESHWARSAAEFAAARGLFAGVGDGLFAPDRPMTRAMFATVLYSLADRPAVSGSSAFTDVADGAWYARAVTWGQANGIISGYGNGRFGPDDLITREQMCALIVSYLRWAGLTAERTTAANTFADSGSISSWARDSVAFCQTRGLISGRPGNLFAPKANATRAENSVVFRQMILNVLTTMAKQ